MNPVAHPVPTVAHLRSLTLSRRIRDSHPNVNGGVPWDWVGFFGEASVENISTAQSEYFWLKTGGIPGSVSFSQTSPSVVKSASDVSWFTSNGYPEPPLGAVLRGVNRDGTPGDGNYLEITPVGWYMNVLLEIGDVNTARKLYQFARWMSIDASFYGTPIKLVAGIAQARDGQWKKNQWTVLLRNQALVAWGVYRLYQRTQDREHLSFARDLLGAVALAINNVSKRIANGELPNFVDGALYHAYTWSGEGNSYRLTWNRWTIEHLLGVSYLLEAAREVEGGTTTLVDPEGTSYTINSLLQRVGRWVDQYFVRPWIMRRGNPKAPYLPYQFLIQQASHNAPEYYKGVNFDWTEESGTTFGDTWWVGDLELWGIIGMLRMKRLGFVSSPVERFLWDWLRLPGPEPYTWYDRYQFDGRPLAHDRSSPIVFSSLYGLALLEGFQPSPPPPRYSVSLDHVAGVVRVKPEWNHEVVVRDGSGSLVGVYTGEFSLPMSRGFVYLIDES